MKTILSTLLLLASPHTLAETHDELVERAFASIEFGLHDSWSYVETTQNGDGIYVARFDPRMPDDRHWKLLSVDDQEPTYDELDAFSEEKANHHDDDSDPDDSEAASMVADGSLELLEESDSYWQFRFKPRTDTDDEEEFMSAVEGTLQVVKDGHYVAWIRMRNRETVKPGKGVKLEVFDTRLAFAPAYEGGPVVPQSVETKVKGRAMLVIKFDEEERISYSDYERVID